MSEPRSGQCPRRKRTRPSRREPAQRRPACCAKTTRSGRAGVDHREADREHNPTRPARINPWDARNTCYALRRTLNPQVSRPNRTAVHVRRADHKATTQRDERAASLHCTGLRRPSAGKAARLPMVLLYRRDMPARKRPAPRPPQPPARRCSTVARVAPAVGRRRAALVTERDHVPVRRSRTGATLREPVPLGSGVARRTSCSVSTRRACRKDCRHCSG